MSKIVPDEPTQEMLQAGIKAFQHAYSSGDPLTDWHAFYKAAIAAAPAPVDGLVERLRGEVSEGRAGFDALPSSSSLPGFDQYKIAMSGLLDLMDEAAAALQSRDEGWQAIESWPKDHFARLAHGPYGIVVAFLDVTGLWWPYPADEPLGYKPTHWMPLPTPPRKP